MNAKVNKSTNEELRDDLLQIIEEFLPAQEYQEFSKFIDEADTKHQSDLSKLSKTEIEQLEFQIDFVEERYYLDRSVTYAKNKLPASEYFTLMIKLGELCISHGMYNYAQEIIQSIKRENTTKNIHVDSLFIQADVYARKGKWQKSLESLTKAKKIFTDLGDENGLAKCDNLIGSIYGEKGKLNEATEYFKKSHEYAKSNKDLNLQAMLEINLGIINSIRSDYNVASIYFTDSLHKLEQLNDFRRIAEVEHNIGMMYRDKQEYDTAISHIDRAINMAIKYECHSILTIAYLGKAEILVNLEELEYASAISKKALETANELNDRLTIAEVYRVRGMIYRMRKKYRLAENCFKSALRINDELESKLNSAECNFELSLLYREMKDKVEESRYLNYSLNYYNELNRKLQIDEIQKRLEEIQN